MSADGFDHWRENYKTISTEAHSRMYSESYARDPKHASFSGRAVRVFLNQMGGTPTVAEVGGRNGALARAALESTPSIFRWINYEICRASSVEGESKDRRYEVRLMDDFRWWKSHLIEGDLLIMSHVIEHLSDEDAKGLIASIPEGIKGVHVQAPIAMRGPVDWKGFNGAHILSMGWIEINEEFEKRGFRAATAYDGATWVRK